MLPWLRQAFQPVPLLVGRDVIWSTRGVQQGYPLGPLLFAAGIQAALDALPPGGALPRWYLDEGVFMGSVAEVEGVLTALQQTLPPPVLELNLRKTSVWGPSLVPAASPPAAATRLHLERGTEVLGVPIHSPLYPSPVGNHLGTLKGTFARKCAAVAVWLTTRAPMPSCGPAWAPRRSCTPSASCLSATLRPSRRTSVRPSEPPGTAWWARPRLTRRRWRPHSR